MSSKKNQKRISSPDDLNKYLQSTKPITWIVLVSVILLLIGFFIWSFLATITFKIYGKAQINSGQVTLTIEEKKLSQLKVGQKVYIANVEGEITEIKDDGHPIVSNFTLADGVYDYYIVTRQFRPIDYLTNKY